MADLILDNITKRFGEKEIFKDFSLKIEPGEFVCISGVSGKGKSTLLNIMGIMDYPDSGRVVIKGVENPRYNKRSGRMLLKNEISYVFQNYGLVDDRTVLYNLQISTWFSKKTEERDIAYALDKVGLNQNIVKQKVFELSGGEQQRVALARIYLKSSSIILADEPTGSLDAGNRENVMDILKNINNEGKTVVIVSHDKEVEKCAKRIINL